MNKPKDSGIKRARMHSPDFVADNIEKLAKLFPGCIVESKDEKGKLRNFIDFDLLRQELSGNVVEGVQERYRLDWPGKQNALLAANAPIAKTLRPCYKESVDFDTTRNLFIEGDNLEALKLLQETYLGKVKMIYIDPPYNTGHDFVYSDKFTALTEDYLLDSGQKDEDGNRLLVNTESNGRFHSDWLSMMYPRLKLARNLLRDDGVIFISIDDRELGNLRKLCDEVFGEKNLIANYIWKARSGKDHTAKYVSINHEIVLCYAKNYTVLEFTQDIRITNGGKYKDERGTYSREQIRQWGTNDRRIDRPTMYYPVVAPDGGEIFPVKENGEEGRWRINHSRMQKMLDERRIDFVFDEAEKKWSIYAKKYDGEKTKTAFSSMLESYGTSASGTREIKKLFGEKVFDTVKPMNLIKHLVVLSKANQNDIVLDFFSGAATTAHAVMQINAEDNGQRKFIMVQVSEACDEKSEAFKAGYSNIAEIGKERIRRAGQKLKEDNALSAPDLDIGFRVLKIDSSNMHDVYYRPDALSQGSLESSVSNIKTDRNDEDLLFQVLLDWGVDLTLPVTTETMSGRKVFFVDGNALAACFDRNSQIDSEFCKKLARRRPLRVVFTDAGFKDDSAKINVEQIFKLISPHTDMKCL